MRHATRAGLLAALALTLTAAAGCGDRPAALAAVTGTVTRGGKPVPDLGVNFVPEAGQRSFAKTDAAGKYALVHIDGTPGAAAGRHKVWVQLPPAPPGADGDKKPARPRPPGDLADLLKKYGSLDATPLSVTVVAGSAQVIDLPLD